MEVRCIMISFYTKYGSYLYYNFTKYGIYTCIFLLRSEISRGYRDDDSGDDEPNQDSFYPPPTHSSRSHTSKKCSKQCERQKEVQYVYYILLWIHNPCNTEKAELTSILHSYCIKINFHIWKLILNGLCKLLYWGEMESALV